MGKNKYAADARKNFMEGYNCSQSVVLAYSDLIEEHCGINRETLACMASAFGGGMGRLREVCGAVSGMFFVLGLLNGYSDPSDSESKARVYENVQAIADSFERQNGSIICRKLLGLTEGKDVPVPMPRNAEYYEKRPCAHFVECAAEIMEQHLSTLGLIE